MEKKLVMEVLDKGKKNGQFNIHNTYDTASLFPEILRGLRRVFFNNNKFTAINDKEYRGLIKRITAATDILIKGLMYKEPKDKSNKLR
jgi:hypothetical protein